MHTYLCMWRCKELEQLQCSAAVLQGVGMQAVVTEFLINNADSLFSDSAQMNGTTDVVAGQSNECVWCHLYLPCEVSKLICLKTLGILIKPVKYWHVYTLSKIASMATGGPKNGLFLEVCNSRVCWRRIAFYISNYSVFIQSKTGVLYVTIFKYSLRNVSVMTLRKNNNEF